MTFAFRPHQLLILGLYNYFHSPEWSIPSNFPALARRIEYLQQLEPGCPADPPAYSSEAPQERDIDLRLANRRVGRALSRLSPRHQEVIVASYKATPQDPRLELALTPILVGLAKFSKWAPVERYADQPKILTAIRIELDEIWREAHRAYEREYQSC